MDRDALLKNLQEAKEVVEAIPQWKRELVERAHLQSMKALGLVQPWKLWLDDERPVPEGFRGALSSQEALDLIGVLGPPELMSLDHDLGGDDTTMVFLRGLSEVLESPPRYRVHSANPVGRENILAFLRSWEKSRMLP